ncbi:hypothetical protein Dvina_28215 [Dactylosporangium vinaceum]|uniref:SnoaL-like domain-containing protein n=1 Tax=Dactylosporangium vinaceum TaxID=53362 RepID=A0ABV5MMN9_9ACTN|nr:hypothetical protein [Dactylosporangium vinaceum]UAB92258.1 hypothetical protein Dvina_28215 [Dactylosporangium vinaceum]
MTWTPLDADVAAFMAEYDSGSLHLFASPFLALDPARAVAVTPAQLGAALPARRAMFDRAGVGPLQRTTTRQQRLDDKHILVGAAWSADRTSGEPFTTTATLLLRREDTTFQIMVYLNHTDLAAALTPPTEPQP